MGDLTTPNLYDIVDIETIKLGLINRKTINHMGIMTGFDQEKNPVFSRRNIQNSIDNKGIGFESASYIDASSLGILSTLALISYSKLVKDGEPFTLNEAVKKPNGTRILIESNFPANGCTEQVVGYFAGKSRLGGIWVARTNIISSQKLEDYRRYRTNEGVDFYLLKEVKKD